MKRILTSSSMAVLAFWVLATGTVHPLQAKSLTSKAPAAKADGAKAELFAAARDSYAKHKAANALAGPAASFTVAAKRLNNSEAVFALIVHVHDSELLGANVDLEINGQPVEIDGTQILRKVGGPVRGDVHIGRRAGNDADTPLQELAYVVAAPEGANAISVEVRLVAGGKDYGMTFVKGMTGAATAGTAERGAEVETGLSVRPGRPSDKGEVAYVLTSSLQSGCCNVPISVSCGDCHANTNCNVCGGSPTVICSCPQTGTQCSCGVICASGTGCH